MAIVFRVEASDLRKAIGRLRDDDVPFVMAYTLTKTAQDIQSGEVDEMKAVLDRPIAYTLNATYVKPATKRDLTAEVAFKDGFGAVPAWRYLAPEVEGGARSHKSHEVRLIRAGLMKPGEYAVPGSGVKLDGFGNIPASTIQSILGQVLSAPQSSGNSRSQKAKSGGRYFVLRPGGVGNANRGVAPGIYYRSGDRGIVPAILFVTAPRYRKRFPFYEAAKRTFEAQLLVRAREGFDRFVGSRNVQNG